MFSHAVVDFLERVVVKRKNEAVDLEQQLTGVSVDAQVALVDGGTDRALERVLPGLHHGHEGVAHRAGTVVELDRAADIDAAGVDLDRDSAHPALEQGAQPRQAARRAHRGPEHLVLELRVVLADDRDLQLLARAEVGEHARLAHAGHLGQGADRQSLEADMRGERERRVENGGACLAAFHERADRRRISGAVGGGIVGVEERAQGQGRKP